MTNTPSLITKTLGWPRSAIGLAGGGGSFAKTLSVRDTVRLRGTVDNASHALFSADVKPLSAADV